MTGTRDLQIDINDNNITTSYAFKLPNQFRMTNMQLMNNIQKGQQSDADRQRMIMELISRLNIPNVETLTSKKQFAEYMIDIIETNMTPFFTLLRKR